MRVSISDSNDRRLAAVDRGFGGHESRASCSDNCKKRAQGRAVGSGDCRPVVFGGRSSFGHEYRDLVGFCLWGRDSGLLPEAGSYIKFVAAGHGFENSQIVGSWDRR